MSTPDLLRVADLGLTARRRVDPLVAIAFAVIGLALVAAVLGEVVAPKDPHATDLTRIATGPSPTHWFGTDDLGQDVFSRVIVGARTALIGPILISIGALLIGNFLGSLAGYKGGTADSLIMRWVDLMSSIPALLVAIVVAGVLGGGYLLAVALLTVLTAPYDTRIIRGAVLEQRARPYVEAARTSGMSEGRVIFRHVWPNVMPYALANAFLTFAFSIVALSSLSFLGLGVGPGTPDWGRMLSENQSILFENPMAVLAPALCIVGVAAAMNLIGDWIAERFADRGRQR